VTQELIEGGCACGSVRFVASGPAARVGLCHCLNCRKAHASAFNPFAVFRREQVVINGELSTWMSSAAFETTFCPSCGSRISGSYKEGPEIELSLGSFDEPGRLAPQYESWTVRREPWLAPLPVQQNQRDREQA
jgi:hypothetical protein